MHYLATYVWKAVQKKLILTVFLCYCTVPMFGRYHFGGSTLEQEFYLQLLVLYKEVQEYSVSRAFLKR